jgi:uncharacterized protein (TIGR02145 family)
MRKLIFIILVTTISCTEKEIAEPIIIQTDVVYDIENNQYTTVKIGNQWWFAENLKVTKFNDGENIPNLNNQPPQVDIVRDIPAYCWYNNDSSYKENTGALYNGYVLNYHKQVCPEGWKIPSLIDFDILNYTVGENACYKLKSKCGWINNGNGIDIYGFNAKPGGCKTNENIFVLDNSFLYLWSTTNRNNNENYFIYLDYMSLNIGGISNYSRIVQTKNYYFSVRCIKKINL